MLVVVARVVVSVVSARVVEDAAVVVVNVVVVVVVALLWNGLHKISGLHVTRYGILVVLWVLARVCTNEALLHGMGLELEKDDRSAEYDEASRLRAAAASGAGGSSTDPARDRDSTGVVVEACPHFGKFDPLGYVWGRPGHFPLWVFLGVQRQRSGEGQRVRNVAKNKSAHWVWYSSWPWWRFHESERHYWMPGGPSTGRGYSGDLYW